MSKNVVKREDNNITNRVLDMEKSLSRWLTRDLTIFGRNLLTKAEGISKVIYPCHSMYISPKNVKKANSIIFHFLWKNKTHYIKRSQLVREYEMGGINALDFESMVGTFKTKWLKAFLMQPNSMWFHIPNSIFKHLGGIEFLLKCDFEINKIPIKLSNFHRQILQFWKMLFNHNFSPHGSTLWNNRVITRGNKSIFQKDWFEMGVIFVKDLLDRNGNLLDFLSFVEKYNVKCSYKDFKKVCRAIPLSLIQLIRNTLLYSEVTASLPALKVNDCNLIDVKCNNKLITKAMKQKIYHDYNRALPKKLPSIDNQSMMTNAHSKFIKWPVPPKVKETHFKIINNIYNTQ